MTAVHDDVARAVARTDYCRHGARSSAEVRRKEWFHFCVCAPEVDLLVNFSLGDDRHAAARVIVLVRDTHWDGDVDTFEAGDAEVRPGRIDVTCGANRLTYDGRVFRIVVALQDRPIAADLVLGPETMPAVAPNIPLGPGRSLSWVVVPRLRARGWVRIGDRRHRIHDAMCYHDHNWGQFAWGDDFAWEWAFALPHDASPWSVVFTRLTDRRRTRTLEQGLFVWRLGAQHRIFRDHDLEVSTDGFLATRRAFRLPRVMGLLADGDAADVPGSLAIQARARDDEVTCRFTSRDGAQIVVPSEETLTLTAINEVVSDVEVSGRIRGEAMHFSGRGLVEFLRA